MEAIKIMEQWWQALQGLLTYAQFCFDQPVSAPACRDFWLWQVWGALAIGLYILFRSLWKYIRAQREFARNQKRLEARRIVADKETIKAYQPNDKEVEVAPRSQDEIAAEIRNAISQRKSSGGKEEPPTPSKVERKLVAILAADVAGYSRMMAADEEGTTRQLVSYRKIFDSLILARKGRIANTAGDSVLAEFPSPVEAVRCAVEVQEALGARNATLPQERQMHFRIGVNLGDVIVKDGDLLGDGVNVAARIQALAEPGSVYFGGSVYEQIEGKLNLNFTSMGEQSVKNIPRPIRVYRISNAEQGNVSVVAVTSGSPDAAAS
jgi:class 3 adenylate cyclase